MRVIAPGLLVVAAGFWLMIRAKWKLAGSGGFGVTGMATGRKVSPQLIQTRASAESAASLAARNAVIDTPEITSIVSIGGPGRIFHSKCGTGLAPTGQLGTGVSISAFQVSRNASGASELPEAPGMTQILTR